MLRGNFFVPLCPICDCAYWRIGIESFNIEISPFDVQYKSRLPAGQVMGLRNFTRYVWLPVLREPRMENDHDTYAEGYCGFYGELIIMCYDSICCLGRHWCQWTHRGYRAKFQWHRWRCHHFKIGWFRRWFWWWWRWRRGWVFHLHHILESLPIRDCLWL